MTDQRFIIEMGMGNDQYGQDYTKAAARAIEDAIRHSALPLFEATGLSHDAMRVQVTIGVQEPGKVDTNVLKDALPRGTVSITATHGGLNTETGAGNTIVMNISTPDVQGFQRSQGQIAAQMTRALSRGQRNR